MRHLQAMMFLPKNAAGRGLGEDSKQATRNGASQSIPRERPKGEGLAILLRVLRLSPDSWGRLDARRDATDVINRYAESLITETDRMPFQTLPQHWNSYGIVQGRLSCQAHYRPFSYQLGPPPSFQGRFQLNRASQGKAEQQLRQSLHTFIHLPSLSPRSLVQAMTKVAEYYFQRFVPYR